MNCPRCQRLLSEHLDGELAPALRRAVDLHLTECAVCASVRAELAAVTGQLGVLPAAEPGEALWRRIDARLDADERARRRRLWPLLAPAMGAAALLVTAGGARLVESRSQRDARALDEQLRAASSGALLQVEQRYSEAEAEASRLVAEPTAMPDAPRTAGVAPASMQLVAAAAADDAEPLQAALDERARRVLRYAERWPAASTDAVESEAPSRTLRDPWPATPARGR